MPAKKGKSAKKRLGPSQAKPKPASTTKPFNVKNVKNYQQFVQEFSKYAKEEGLKFPGQGGFHKKAGEIFRQIKDQPMAIENAEVIIPQYFEQKLQQPKVTTQKTQKKHQDLEQAIIETGITSFVWYESGPNFTTLFHLPEWRGNYILRIVDGENEFREVRDVEEFRRKTLKLIQKDYRQNLLQQPYPYFEYLNISEENGQVFVNFRVIEWLFYRRDGVKEAIEELQEKSKLERQPKEPGRPPEPTQPPSAPPEPSPETKQREQLDVIEKQISIYTTRKSDLREDMKFYKEEGMTEELESAKAEYKQVDQKIKDLLAKM